MNQLIKKQATQCEWRSVRIKNAHDQFVLTIRTH